MSKTFKGKISSPAMNFITPPSAEPEPAQVGYKPNPAYIETKSRRLALLMQPSLYEKIRARAEAEGVSVNELIHRTLEMSI